MAMEFESKKALEAIDNEFNSEAELDLLAKNNLGSNVVISSSANDTPLTSKNFFNPEKMRVIGVGLLYATLCAFLLIGYAMATGINITTYQKHDLPFYHLALSTAFAVISMLLGAFPIYLLNIDRKVAMSRNSFIFYIASVLPLFIVPIFNMSLPVDDRDSLKLHFMVTAIAILVQGIILAVTMFLVNSKSKKRYPILSRKTNVFWMYYFWVFTMPFLFWLFTNQLNVGDSFESIGILLVFLAAVILLSTLLITAAVVLSNKHYIFHDKLMSKTSQLNLTLMWFMFAGTFTGLGASLINFKQEMNFNVYIILFAVVSLLVVIGHLIFVAWNKRISHIRKANPLSNSIFFNSLLWFEILLLVVMSLFTPSSSESQLQKPYAYYMIIAGVSMLILTLNARLFEIDYFMLNAPVKISFIATIVILCGLFGVLISTLEDSVQIKTQYGMELNVFVGAVALAFFSAVVIANIMVVVSVGKKKLSEEEREKAKAMEKIKNEGETFASQKSMSKSQKKEERIEAKRSRVS